MFLVSNLCCSIYIYALRRSVARSNRSENFKLRTTVDNKFNPSWRSIPAEGPPVRSIDTQSLAALLECFRINQPVVTRALVVWTRVIHVPKYLLISTARLGVVIVLCGRILTFTIPYRKCRSIEDRDNGSQNLDITHNLR